MSRQINLPINQVKLTNVAIVRYNYMGKRYEVACYKNKVLDYRAGLETDLSEVLQTDRIFVNVSKGEFAKSTELHRIFQTKDEMNIIRIILEKGNSIQISDLERSQLYELTQQKIIIWLCTNCVNPTNHRPYTNHQMKQALMESNYTVQPHKPLKKQYLDAIKLLKTTNVIPIDRTMMELSFTYPNQYEQQIRKEMNQFIDQYYQTNGITTGSNTATTTICRKPIQIKKWNPAIQPTSTATTATTTTIMNSMILHVDPSLYREFTTLAKNVSGRIEIMVHHVMAQIDNDGKIIESSTSGQHFDYDTNELLLDDDGDLNNNNNNDNNNKKDAHPNKYEKKEGQVQQQSLNDPIHTRIEKGNEMKYRNTRDDDDDTSDEEEEESALDTKNYVNEKEDDDDDDDDSDSDEPLMVLATRKDLRKARKAKNKEILQTMTKKGKKQQQQHNESDEDSDYDDDESDEEEEDYKKQTINTQNNNKNKKSKKKNKKQNIPKQNHPSTDSSLFSTQPPNSNKVVNQITTSSGSQDPPPASTGTDTVKTTNSTTGGLNVGGSGGVAVPVGVGGGQTCNTCGGQFGTPALYRCHFRSDWHRYNQKLKLMGGQPISELEFLACDADSFFNNLTD